MIGCMSGLVLVVPRCPNCGAPLQLLAERTCAWCHSPVEATVSSASSGAADDGHLAAAEAQNFDAIARTWTLRPDGPQIDWSAGVASKGTTSRRLLDTAHEGVQQPAGTELAADPDLDKEFCAVLADAMTQRR